MKKLIFILFALGVFCVSASAQNDTSKLKKLPDSSKVVGKPLNKPASTVTSTGSSCYPPTPTRNIIGWALIIIIAIASVIVAFSSNLLRDPITDKDAFMTAAHATTKYANENDITKIPKPFSLARTQLCVWTVIISCTYIYLIIIKHFPMTDVTINSTLLLLMGISAGTTAASNIIDNSPSVPNYNGPSEGLLMDILSDQNGINIHRFQNVIWTIVAVVLFICKIPKTGCEMLPDLDSTLIALTGISSATYLSLKINENKTPVIAAPPANAPANNNNANNAQAGGLVGNG